VNFFGRGKKNGELRGLTGEAKRKKEGIVSLFSSNYNFGRSEQARQEGERTKGLRGRGGTTVPNFTLEPDFRRGQKFAKNWLFWEITGDVGTRGGKINFPVIMPGN